MDIINIIKQISDLKILLNHVKVKNQEFLDNINQDRTYIIRLDDDKELI